MSNLKLYYDQKDQIRENLNKFTEKVFQFIPKIKNVKILDIGCGTGVPTIKLAELSKGDIIGIDIDDLSLNLLKEKIKQKGMQNQITIIKKSLLTMDFPNESFDIIWAEGSIFQLEFENSIKNWQGLLKPNGFLVIHDEHKEITNKLEFIQKHHYKLISHFKVSYTDWQDEYFRPLESIMNEFKQKYPDDSDLQKILAKDKQELIESKTNSNKTSSHFFIMQKT